MAETRLVLRNWALGFGSEYLLPTRPCMLSCPRCSPTTATGAYCTAKKRQHLELFKTLVRPHRSGLKQAGERGMGTRASAGGRWQRILNARY